MPISGDIYSQYAPRVQSPTEVTNALGQQALQQSQIASNGLALRQAQAVDMQRQGLRDAVQSGKIDLANPAHQDQALAQFPDVAPALLKSVQDRQQVASKTKLEAAQADEHSVGAKVKKMDLMSRAWAGLDPTDDNALVSTVAKFVQSKDLDPTEATAMLEKVTKMSPAERQKWYYQQGLMGLSAHERVTNDTAQRGQDITRQNNIDTNAAHVQTTGMTNATSLKTAGIAASTSRANNADTIKKDYTIAGIGADGSPSANVESMAQMIAAGKVAPITGFALARPQGQAVMARVAQINPEYDATTYGAKVKAAKDFGTGQQGNAMRSFAVAGDHLDQLGKLADALNNKDTQAINKIGNYISEQTGSPAPTNFDAAKDIVSKEVVKAIVAGGGGVSEREELARLMDKAKSPAQLKGVITQYRSLMAAQHDHLLQQRSAAGLDPSTLPAYSAPATASGVPAEIADILKKHGKPGK